MNSQELVRMLKAVPFEPFELEMSSGTRHLIRHPECLVVGRNTSYIFTPSPEPGIFEDDWVRISNLHITSIRPAAKAAV